MQPRKDGDADYDDPNLYPVPTAGRSSHRQRRTGRRRRGRTPAHEPPLPRRPDNTRSTLTDSEPTQRSGNRPGGGGVGHNRARPATIGADRHAQKQRPAPSRRGGPRPPTAQPRPTGLPGQRPGTHPHPDRLTLGVAVSSVTPIVTRRPARPQPRRPGSRPPSSAAAPWSGPALSNRACRDARSIRAPHTGCSKRRQYPPTGVSPRAPAGRFPAASGTLVSPCPPPTASCC